MPMPAKPDRAQITVRAPHRHMDLYRERAQACGMNLSDYLAMVLAESHQLDVPEYLRDRHQLSIPLSA